MADLLSVGASVVAFIGLSGQVLHGCEYVYNLINNVRDAPEDLQNLGVEVQDFRTAVLSFQRLLQQFVYSTNFEVASEQIGSALKSASLAINDLKHLVGMHTHDGRRDWWKNIKAQKRKSMFAKFVERLRKAKADIALTQSNAIL